MSEKPEDIEAAISSINAELCELVNGEKDNDAFQLVCLKSGSDAYQSWVEFCGQAIWDSENDERTDPDNEPLENYLRQRVKECCATFAEIRYALKAQA